jgi:hypothetical protein
MIDLPVTLVTKDASRDSLTDADYIGIIDSLRTLFGYSWQRIADETGYNSKAWWSLVAQGKRQLDDEARNALRRVTDGELPEQPPSVAAVTDAMIDVDAVMYLVGMLEPEQRAKRVIMLADDTDMILHVNGAVTAHVAHEGVELPASAQNDVAPRVASVGANREPVYRPVFSTDEKERFEKLGGLRKIIDAGVKALAMENNNVSN